MLRGELYNAGDPGLSEERSAARIILKQYNNTLNNELELRRQLLDRLLARVGEELWIEPPFYCDYGSNIIAGNKVYFNFNCVVLDVMQVSIGNNVLIGPAVQIYTAMHPMDYQQRATGAEYAKPVNIGSDVWIGGGAVICPGVTIGNRSVIGAGSVVTKNIPDDSFAAGNPARVIRLLIPDENNI